MWNVQHNGFAGAQAATVPLSEGRGILSDIDYHVEYLADGGTDKFCLAEGFRLKVQPADDVWCAIDRDGMLRKLRLETGVSESVDIENARKTPTAIADRIQVNEVGAGERDRFDVTTNRSRGSRKRSPPHA